MRSNEVPSSPRAGARSSDPASHRPFGRGVLVLRADLWRIPLCLSLLAVALFVATAAIDAAAARGSLTLPAWISVGGPDDARAILGAMLGAVSTVLALIFSVALLVLSMAVSQFGPRILYRFVNDAITQVTIGLFLASFVHTLLTFVVTRQDAAHRFVPQLTILSSVVLVIVCFAFLVLFSHRTAVSIQTQNVVANIIADLHEAIAERARALRLYSLPHQIAEDEAAIETLAARCAAEGGMVRAWRTGFVQEVDIARVLAAADEADAVVQAILRPGQFVLAHTPLCRVLPSARTDVLAPALRRAIAIGTHRTLKQDFEFAIAQLVEIALRALSPAVNDTFTGLTCIDWLGDAIRTIHASPVASGAVAGVAGRIRVLWTPPRFERLVKAAFDQIRQAGAGNPAVQIRLLRTFAGLATQISDQPSRDALRSQAEAVWEAVSRDALVTFDHSDVEAAYRSAYDALAPVARF